MMVRKLSAIVLFMYILIGSLGQVLAAETYTWQGILEAGQTLYISDNYLNASITVLSRPVALIKVNTIPYFLANGTVIIGRMNVTVVPLNESAMLVVVRSSEPFSATFWPVVVARTVIVNQTNETLIEGLKTLINQLNSTLQEREALIENLTAELAEKEKEVQNLSSQIKVLKDQVTALEQQNKVLVENNTLLLAKVENLTEELNASRTLILQLNSTLHGKNLTIGNLTAQVAALEEKNRKLRGQISELENKLKTSNLTVLQARLLNLTKENRKLKAELANLTNKYNQLKAKAEFLEQQNGEYRGIIEQVMKEESQQSKQSYIEKAKKERLIGSVIIKALIFSLIIVGLIGYGLYKKKRSWELGGL